MPSQNKNKISTENTYIKKQLLHHETHYKLSIGGTCFNRRHVSTLHATSLSHKKWQKLK